VLAGNRHDYCNATLHCSCCHSCSHILALSPAMLALTAITGCSCLCQPH
jgi:hypothetical protein